MSKLCTHDLSAPGTISIPSTDTPMQMKIVVGAPVHASDINSWRALVAPAPQRANPISCPLQRLFYSPGGEMVQMAIGCSK